MGAARRATRQLLELGAGIGIDPFLPPVSPGIVKGVGHIQIPEIVPIRVVCFDIGEVKENPIVIGAVLPDQLIIIMDMAVTTGIGIAI